MPQSSTLLTSPPDIMDAKELSSIVFGGAISPWTIYQMVKNQGMPYIENGRNKLFSRTGVVQWMESRQKQNRMFCRVR